MVLSRTIYEYKITFLVYFQKDITMEILIKAAAYNTKFVDLTISVNQRMMQVIENLTSGLYM